MIRLYVRDTAGNAFAQQDFDDSAHEEALYLAELWARDGFRVEIVPVVVDEPKP